MPLAVWGKGLCMCWEGRCFSEGEVTRGGMPLAVWGEGFVRGGGGSLLTGREALPVLPRPIQTNPHPCRKTEPARHPRSGLLPPGRRQRAAHATKRRPTRVERHQEAARPGEARGEGRVAARLAEHVKEGAWRLVSFLGGVAERGGWCWGAVPGDGFGGVRLSCGRQQAVAGGGLAGGAKGGSARGFGGGFGAGGVVTKRHRTGSRFDRDK